MESTENSYTQIFIAKIHPRVTERDLKYKFKKFGEIQDVRLKRGYAFIVKIIFKYPKNLF
jgi:RNA recognition motif-containing protein